MTWSAAMAIGALLVSLAVGVVVHESLHLLVLRRAGVECSLTFESARDWRSFDAPLTGDLASVELESIPPSCTRWHFRTAALAPLAMVFVAGGYVTLVQLGLPAETLPGSLALIGWLAWALPSPADFASVWDTDEALERLAGPESDDGRLGPSRLLITIASVLGW